MKATGDALIALAAEKQSQQGRAEWRERVDNNVDTSKQEILGRLVAAETDARHKVDEASLQAQQTVAEANATATQMLADARRQAAANAEALINRSKQEISDEVAALHMAADRRDSAMEEAARKNLDAAASLVVRWVTGEGG